MPRHYKVKLNEKSKQKQNKTKAPTASESMTAELSLPHLRAHQDTCTQMLAVMSLGRLLDRSLR